MAGNNPKLDLVSINAYTKYDEILSIGSQILSGNENLTSIKGHNSVTNVRKIAGNIPKLDLVSINAYTIFDEILSIGSQDIERK